MPTTCVLAPTHITNCMHEKLFGVHADIIDSLSEMRNIGPTMARATTRLALPVQGEANKLTVIVPYSHSSHSRTHYHSV